MRVNQQPAVILHSRPYTESSLILDVLSLEYGRISLLAKGARRPKDRAKKAIQPFQEYSIGWVGKGEMPILTQLEYQQTYLQLDYKSRVCAFYANELLSRTLQRFDPHSAVYNAYVQLLQKLSTASQRELILREFEKTLLSNIGYALILDREAETGELIKSSHTYLYVKDKGPIQAQANNPHALSNHIFVEGEVLLSIAQGKFRNDDVMLAAKLFMRRMLAPLLGRRPLISRDLLYPTLQT